MKIKIEKQLDDIFLSFRKFAIENRLFILIGFFLFFLSIIFSQLPYTNLFFSPTIIWMIGVCFLLILFSKKILYILFILSLIVGYLSVISGAVFSETLNNILYMIILAVVLRQILIKKDKPEEKN
ncbi:MAG: hypothetical protein Q7K55_07475 [Candidatus Levybacteria bacterium]|nr:hypothetical protein [Candidatus Levybacteria bacterium]